MTLRQKIITAKTKLEKIKKLPLISRARPSLELLDDIDGILMAIADEFDQVRESIRLLGNDMKR